MRKLIQGVPIQKEDGTVESKEEEAQLVVNNSMKHN